MTAAEASISSAVVLFSTTTGANGNDNNIIDTCDISDGAATPANGILSSGTSTTTATANSGNTVTVAISRTTSVPAAPPTDLGNLTGSTDWTISNNRFFQTVSRTYTTNNTHRAIQIAGGNGYAVTGNTIGLASSAGTGTYTVTGASNRFIGIDLAVGTTTASSVQNNTFRVQSYNQRAVTAREMGSGAVLTYRGTAAR